MEAIRIEKTGEGLGGFTVYQGDSKAELSWEEMLGLVASLTMPQERPCLHWMRTPEQEKAWRDYLDGMEKEKQKAKI